MTLNRDRGRKRGKGKEKGKKEEEKGKGRWKKDSLRNVGRTDTKVILYYVQCYALHWIDNNYYKMVNKTHKKQMHCSVPRPRWLGRIKLQT